MSMFIDIVYEVFDLRALNITGRFSTILYKGHIYLDFLLAILHI